MLILMLPIYLLYPSLSTSILSALHQHKSALKGHKECVMVPLRHGCNIHLQDVNGDTPLWEATAAKHHPIFEILYHWASISDPYVSGDLLCTAARRNELTIMKELLKHGLLVN